MSRTAYAEIEAERNKVLDRHLTMLSNWKEYHVNIDWLRTGAGEMFLETESDILEKLKKDFSLSDSQFGFINEFIRLPDSEKEIILSFMRKVAAHGSAAADPAPDPDDIEAKVAEYREQLEKEKEAGERSSASFDSEMKDA